MEKEHVRRYYHDISRAQGSRLCLTSIRKSQQVRGELLGGGDDNKSPSQSDNTTTTTKKLNARGCHVVFCTSLPNSPTDEAHAVHVPSSHADLLVLLLLHLHVPILLLVRVPAATAGAATAGAGIPLALGRTAPRHFEGKKKKKLSEEAPAHTKGCALLCSLSFSLLIPLTRAHPAGWKMFRSHSSRYSHLESVLDDVCVPKNELLSHSAGCVGD